MPRLPAPAARRVAALGLLLAVVGLHGLLFEWLQPPDAPPPALPRPGPALQVRALPPPAVAVAEAPHPEPPAVATPPPVRRAPAAPAAAEPAPAEPPAPAGAPPLPVYATRLPGPVQLAYQLQRGERQGHAWLRWQPETGAYRLQLETEWTGQPAQGSSSHGLLDADGVAPVRHAELRKAREVRAANFQREAGRITFSGPSAVHALVPGAQDRLSWLIQLPAIVEADTALARPGQRVVLLVVGTRGDAEPWQFEVEGREALQLPAGPVPDALRLKREPTRPYDSRVEVWLDPARAHLPVRAVFTLLPGGQPLAMELAAAQAAP